MNPSVVMWGLLHSYISTLTQGSLRSPEEAAVISIDCGYGIKLALFLATVSLELCSTRRDYLWSQEFRSLFFILEFIIISYTTL